MSLILRTVSMVLLAAGLWAPAASAQGPQNLRFSLFGGVGGSVDEDDAGLGNASLQIGLSTETAASTLLRLRAGVISYGSTDRIGRLNDPSVEYLSAGGEYRFDEAIYTSGVFFALGAYRLEGRLAGAAEEETVLGGSVGATGEFDLGGRLGLVGELTVHVLDSDLAQVLLTAHLGLAIDL